MIPMDVLMLLDVNDNCQRCSLQADGVYLHCLSLLCTSVCAVSVPARHATKACVLAAALHTDGAERPPRRSSLGLHFVSCI